MDTNTIQALVDPLGVKVVPLNFLPTESIENGAYIFNQDPAPLPGVHWCTLIIKTDSKTNYKTLFYSDSLGIPPLTKAIIDLININRPDELVFNKFRLQEPTANTCGAYSIMLLWHMHRGGSFIDFFNKFDPYDGKKNDQNIRIMLEDMRKSLKNV